MQLAKLARDGFMNKYLQHQKEQQNVAPGDVVP